MQTLLIALTLSLLAPVGAQAYYPPKPVKKTLAIGLIAIHAGGGRRNPPPPAQTDPAILAELKRIGDLHAQSVALHQATLAAVQGIAAKPAQPLIVPAPAAPTPPGGPIAHIYLSPPNLAPPVAAPPLLAPPATTPPVLAPPAPTPPVLAPPAPSPPGLAPPPPAPPGLRPPGAAGGTYVPPGGLMRYTHHRPVNKALYRP